MPPSAPSTPHWLPLSPLGSGSSSHVSLSLNLADGSIFAAKSAPSHQLLLNELTLLHSLHSPFIIQCLGADLRASSGGFSHLFLEYMDVGSLADVLRRSPAGKLCDENIVRQYTRAIVQGLDYLHQNGVVHCDIKSHNILIGQSGVKIGDLGAAKRINCGESVAVMDGMVRGTPLWMAPEVLRGEEQGAPSDIWSLGCTVVEMLQGKPPWGHITSLEALLLNMGSSNENPPLPEHASAEAKDFLRRCLHREPTKRATTAELLQHSFLCGIKETLSAEAQHTFKRNQPSPRSTLDVLYSSGSESDCECESMLASTASLHSSTSLCTSGSPSPAGWRSASSSPSPAQSRSSEKSEWVTVRRAEKCRNVNQVPFMLSSAAGHEEAMLPVRRGCEVSFDCAAFLQKRREDVG